ncbi:MAG: cyclic nucleotide-binding domain-containing protein [Oligoflexia bacterium]|nr:cyclic nucleotide-binding domain-containing protein [Oligoflexia bacterium]
MQPAVESIPELEALNAESRRVSAALLTHLSPIQSDMRIDAQSQLPADGHFYLLREGLVQYFYGARQIGIFEAGDLINLEHQRFSPAVRFQTDFAVVVDVYALTDLQAQLDSHAPVREMWSSLISVHAARLGAVSASLSKLHSEVAPKLLQFERGETIIRQNDKADKVYTLLDGSAEAIVDGKVVGKILGDEIFGALAAINGAPRTATVRCTSTCTVLSLPAENFIQLLDTHPHTVLKMIEDMARVIKELNAQVVR